MKRIVIVILAALLFVGCTHDTTPRPNDAGPLPVITLRQDGVTIPGVEESYCYNTVCVDKVGIPELTQGKAFPPVFATSVTAYFSPRPQEITVEVFSSDGKLTPLCKPKAQLQESNEARINLCPELESGRFILSVSAFFSSGDMSYVFPLDVRPLPQ